jgi:hypothetical protein
MAKKNSDSPQSFSYTLLPGEGLVCGERCTTPWAPYKVECTPQDLTSELLRPWFIQSIEPLVGASAAKRLSELMEGKDRAAFADFWDAALKYRKSLTPGKS